jgi:DnaJ-class molecular chaperone
MNNNIFGDIKIITKILPHPYFGRSGLDLIYQKEIELKEALVGFSFELTHLNGKSYTLNNNQNNIINPGFRKVIPNMGFLRENHNGNLIVEFSIKFPKVLTKEQIVKLNEIL